MSAQSQPFHWKQSQLVWSSFRHFIRSHIALTLGIAVATAVIIGALAVGDSVRGSLRGLVLRRLANVELLLQTRHFFQIELVNSISKTALKSDSVLVPLIVLSNSTVEHRQSDQTRRASHVQVLGVDESFIAALDDSNRRVFAKAPGPDEVMINETLARELKVHVGDQVTLLLSKAGGVPADNPLGRRDDVSRNLPRQKIVSILSDDSIGAIRFQSSQQAPLNVFASLETIQEFLEVEGKANSAMAFAKHPRDELGVQAAELAASLSQQLKPSLEDFGLQLDRHRRVYPDPELGETSDLPQETIYDYYQLSSKDLIIDHTTESAIVKALGESNCTRLFAYLVNSIQKVAPDRSDGADSVLQTLGRRARQFGTFIKSALPILKTEGRKAPYSIIIGVSSPADFPLPDFEDLEGLRTPPCAVNSWLAKELEVGEGDRLQIEFYEPETVDGRPTQVYSAIKIGGVIEIAEPLAPFRRNRDARFGVRPTFANDANMTPSVPGITDQKSISNWDVPFELELRDLILKQDDKYWEDHRLTPKIFISLAYAQQMFGSRFGDITSVRIPARNVVDERSLRNQIEEGLHDISQAAGYAFLPVRQQQLQAASGTTPFDMLFLSLSFFVIIAAFLLVAILFRLGIQQRTAQLGLLMAQGFTISKVRFILLQEFFIVASLGAVLGIPLGLGYARLMIAGLESWWIGAISTSFLEFSFSVRSMLIGLAVGLGSSMLTIFLSMRRIAMLSPLSLLRGQDTDSATSMTRSRVGWAPSVVCAILAVALAGIASGQSGMARAGCFFGGGILLLISAWLVIRQVLIVQGAIRLSRSNLFFLAFRAICRNPLRSSLSIGLLAVASFLISSMGVFKMSPSRAGYGGFDLIGISSQPVHDNLGSPAARRSAIGPSADQLSDTVIMPMRMREGDDASCTNLFQVSQPTILGVPASLQSLTESAQGYQFSWMDSSKPEAPWDQLQVFGTGSKSDTIPVILDQNTALWSLKQGGSLGSEIVLTIDGREVHFRVVGLLSNSVLQGKLMIADRNFRMLFPNLSGFRFFLISTGSSATQETVINILEDGWSASGMDVTSSEELLQRLLGVQNTYISAFQALGALGLLLGTIGLVAVQLRSVLERRKELALMQAVGFSKLRIGKLLTLETALLLGVGFLIGVGCAALALIPYVQEVGPQLSVIQPMLMLLAVFACGFLSAILAIFLALKLPLLESLKAE